MNSELRTLNFGLIASDFGLVTSATLSHRNLNHKAQTSNLKQTK